jgi:hypothetical protein
LAGVVDLGFMVGVGCWTDDIVKRNRQFVHKERRACFMYNDST